MYEEVSFKGRSSLAPAVKAKGSTIIISGRFLRTAAIANEFYEADALTDPLPIIDALREPAPKADLFTFTQKITDREPRFSYYYELDNVAAIPISSYDDWWNHQINSNDRKTIRKAGKRGVEVRSTPFDDALVSGIVEIYNETPIRQGKRFWHYGKDFDTVKRDTSTYGDRSEFIGAYSAGELIGFIKIVYCGKCGNMTLILAKIKDRDKCTTTALIAKAVEVCAQRGMSYLTYGKFVYGKKGEDSLSEFKRNLRFERIDVPQYFIPLTRKGEAAIRLGFHHYPYSLLPAWLLKDLIKLRSSRMRQTA
jgi:hypothetical protein